MLRRKKISILLVEDDEVDVMNVQRAFDKAGFGTTLHVASDGVEALEMLRGNRKENLDPFPQILLLDLNLPRMNGIELLREMRSDPRLRRMVVIVLSTSDDARDVFAAYELNVAGYLVKPIGFPRFVEMIQHVSAYWSLNELPQMAGEW